MNDCLHKMSASPLEGAHKRVQFAANEDVEPHTPLAAVHVAGIADPPQQSVEIANLLKDLKPPSFGG